VGCASVRDERHVAPIFSRYSPAGGGVGTESVGGMFVGHKPGLEGPLDYWAMRPLLSKRVEKNGDRFYWFFPPLGTYKVRERERVWQLLPIARYQWRLDEGDTERWSFLSLPGIYWAKTSDGRIVRAWFPFGGVADQFFSFDRLEFFLFPLYVKTQRHGRTTKHFLFPIFSVSRGAGGPAWRFWPLIGHNRWEGRFDRWFFLWPIFHYQRNGLNKSEKWRETVWTAFPLFGKSTRGTRSSYTFLWPFFGWGKDPETGFWALDAPWPIVRFLEPGTTGGGRRHRVWPFYSWYEGDGLTSRWILWPFFNKRTEEYGRVDKKTTNVFPFWHSWSRDGEEGRTTFRRFWPLVRVEGGPDSRAFSTLALNPFPPLAFIDEHYAWLWQIYSYRRDADQVQERSWLGLWRREKDHDEDRRSFSLLWARRDYTQAGVAVRETSWLFGLLRFRKREGEGTQWLRPAVPGPGWPLARVPRSIPPAVTD